MTAPAAHFDHPISRLALAAGLAAAIALGVLAGEQAIVDAERGGLLLLAPFVAGAVLFVLYAPAALHYGRSHDRRQVRAMIWFGLSFVLWGPVIAVFCGGVFGLLHALVCAMALTHWTRSDVLTVLPLLCLIPAWGLTIAANALWTPVDESGTLWILLPVLLWNVAMAVAFALWSHWRRQRPLVNTSGECSVCGYDLTGLESPVCPECGAPVYLPRSTADGGIEPP